MLLGIWKNVHDLEESLSLPELEAVTRAARDRESRHHKFMAAVQGINLDEDEGGKDRFEEVKRRAEAKRTGKSTESLELESFGLDIIVED